MPETNQRETGPRNSYGRAEAEAYETDRRLEAAWVVENDHVDAFLRSLPRVRHLLDAPIGTGRFLPLYAGRVDRVTGIDLSEEMIDEARKKLAYQPESTLILTLRQGDLLAPAGVEPAQVVISWRFFHLIPAELLTQALQALSASLSSDGLLLVQAYHPRQAWRRWIGRGGRFLSTHATGRRATPITAAWAHIPSHLHTQTTFLTSVQGSRLRIREQKCLSSTWDIDCWAYTLERA